MTQREQDIANIEYFLSDKVSLEGHSQDIAEDCRKVLEPLFRYNWYTSPQGTNFWSRVFHKLSEIHFRAA